MTVAAFLVDHGLVAPAFGYRIAYRGRSVVRSGDTKPSDNLVKFAQGAGVLIHELGRSKQDAVLSGPADDVVPPRCRWYDGITPEPWNSVTI